ncbi:hypothetical protein [Arcticibacter sp.]|uniref:hypothetical protein n=1 Tax=Arcticibacter sp. TaxID=1872630 RepID=UPI00388FD3B9
MTRINAWLYLDAGQLLTRLRAAPDQVVGAATLNPPCSHSVATYLWKKVATTWLQGG